MRWAWFRLGFWLASETSIHYHFFIEIARWLTCQFFVCFLAVSVLWFWASGGHASNKIEFIDLRCLNHISQNSNVSLRFWNSHYDLASCFFPRPYIWAIWYPNQGLLIPETAWIVHHPVDSPFGRKWPRPHYSDFHLWSWTVLADYVLYLYCSRVETCSLEMSWDQISSQYSWFHFLLFSTFPIVSCWSSLVHVISWWPSLVLTSFRRSNILANCYILSESWILGQYSKQGLSFFENVFFDICWRRSQLHDFLSSH